MDDWCNTFLALICQIAHSEPPTHSLTNAFLIQATPSFTGPSTLYFVKLMLTVFLLATSLYFVKPPLAVFLRAICRVVFYYGFHSGICWMVDKWILDRLFIAIMTRGGGPQSSVRSVTNWENGQREIKVKWKKEIRKQKKKGEKRNDKDIETIKG